jgi:hypothetical protein
MPKHPEEKSTKREHPHWPTLEEQLEASHVIRGSALEKLIRENQDFDLLSPEEAHDKLRLPPWLRVYGRKQHPEIKPAPGDPTRGYPLALRDIYNWMLTHQDLERGESLPGERGRHAV